MDTLCAQWQQPCYCHRSGMEELSQHDKALALSLVHAYLLADRSEVHVVGAHDRRRFRKERVKWRLRPVLPYARRTFHTTATLAALRSTTRLPNHNVENALEIARSVLQGGAAARL